MCVYGEGRPDGHDVGEEQQEAEDLQVPASGKVLQSHHDQRHHHQRPKQDLSQTVHLQVKQADLGSRHRSEYAGASESQHRIQEN